MFFHVLAISGSHSYFDIADDASAYDLKLLLAINHLCQIKSSLKRRAISNNQLLKHRHGIKQVLNFNLNGILKKHFLENLVQ